MSLRSVVLFGLFPCILFISCSLRDGTGISDIVTPISSPAGPNASLPHLVTGNDNNLYLSWVEKQDSGHTKFKYARLEGDSWSQPKLIAEGYGLVCELGGLSDDRCG